MNRITKAIAVTLLAAVATVAFAATLNVSWTNATTNTDGTAIPASGPGSLTNTVFEYGPCSPARDAIVGTPVVVTVPAPATSPALPPNIGPGTWCGRVRHTNTYGEESAWTGMAVEVVDAPVPNPPSNFSMGSQQQ